MTCVLGMVVRREREIRNFVKTPFYRVISTTDASGTALRESGGRSGAPGILNLLTCIKKTGLKRGKKRRN